MKLLGRKSDDGMLSCRQVGKVLQSFLDGELDEMTAEKVEMHLDMCRRCGMESDVYRQIKESLAHAQGDVPEIALRRLRHFGQQLAAEAQIDHDHDHDDDGVE